MEYVMAAVGGVLSKVTLEPLVIAVTAVPAFPSKSVKLMLKVTVPSVSPEVMALLAVQEVPEPEIAADVPSMVAAGVCIVSEDVKLTVTVSPVFALAVLELEDAMVTGLKVGATVL
jgi:hypothetical protein